MSINQGEIWLVDFEPSVGSEIKKARPCVVVNDDKLGRFGIKVVLPITEWKDYYVDYPWLIKIEPSNKNNLSKTSTIECYQIKSFSQDRFIKKLGEIDKNLLLLAHKTILKTLNPQYEIKE